MTFAHPETMKIPLSTVFFVAKTPGIHGAFSFASFAALRERVPVTMATP
jgi:hypothetical protein